MDKHLLILIMATAASRVVLGQRIGGDLYRPSAASGSNEPPAQERAYLDYNDYDDYSPAPLPSAGRDSTRDSTRGRLPPLQSKPAPSLNNYYQTDCKSRERTLPHEKYCDHFYQLNGCSDSDDQAILRACPNGLTYTGNGRQGLIGFCDYPHRADCNGREKHNPPISTEHCDWLYGIFGHETSCTRYWTCWNGTATEQFCIGGLLYNEETHACDWPQNVGGCQKHPLCKDDPNGNVPLGKSCNRYWACQGGYPRLQRCPAMLVFDKKRKRCVSPPTEDCEVPATTPAPEDEEGGRNPSGGRRGGNPSGGRRGGSDDRGQPQPQSLPENRRRFEIEGGSPDQRGPPPGAIPFDISNTGASLLSRPSQ